VNNCPDCNYYIGEWVANLKSGTGACYDANQRLLYSGKFVNDKPTGKYPAAANNKSQSELQHLLSGSKYIGQIENNRRNGYGVLMHSNGDVTFGNWSDGNFSSGFTINLGYK